MRYYLGVDWADQTHAVWVVDEQGAKVASRTVPHTAAGLSEWGRVPEPRAFNAFSTLGPTSRPRPSWYTEPVARGCGAHSPLHDPGMSITKGDKRCGRCASHCSLPWPWLFWSP
jgi:hypothetical protein